MDVLKQNWLDSNSVIIVSDDKMEAVFRINYIFCEMMLTYQDLEKYLHYKGIIYGLDKMAIQEIIEKNIICRNVLVAYGTHSQDGQNGRFEFLFNTHIDKAPYILEDGTVDYSLLDRVETVKQGQIIVRYHKRTLGEPGTDVYGNNIPAKDGKELSPLKGKGFFMSDDKSTYYASVDGKVEYKAERLKVSNVLEIKEDVNYLSNHVSFGGDILIVGDVLSGTNIQAKGSIHVKGHVENAVIVSGKDVILDNGMQGGGKGVIICAGDVSGKFFEQVRIRSEGSVNSNAIVNCDIEANGSVVVTGKKGVIIGGSTSAIAGVTVAVLGNTNEIKTTVTVGLADNFYVQVDALEQYTKVLTERVKQIDSALDMIAGHDAPNVINPFQKQRVQLLRTKISINSEIAENTARRNEMLDLLSKAADAKVRVERSVEANVHICVNGLYTHVSKRCVGSVFLRNGAELEQRPVV